MEKYTIQHIQIASDSKGATVTVILTGEGIEIDADGRGRAESAHGTGPVGAVVNALNKFFNFSADPKLGSWWGRLIPSLDPKDSGVDAKAQISVLVGFAGRYWPGEATSVDVVRATGEAYLAALREASSMYIIQLKKSEVVASAAR